MILTLKKSFCLHYANKGFCFMCVAVEQKGSVSLLWYSWGIVAQVKLTWTNFEPRQVLVVYEMWCDSKEVKVNSLVRVKKKDFFAFVVKGDTSRVWTGSKWCWRRLEDLIMAQKRFFTVLKRSATLLWLSSHSLLNV